MADRNNRNNNNDQIVRIFTRLLETNNTVEFKPKFTGQNRDVLPYIFEIDKFLKVNGLTDTNIRFRRIFNTVDSHYQADAICTIELFKSWPSKYQ